MSISAASSETERAFEAPTGAAGTRLVGGVLGLIGGLGCLTRGLLGSDPDDLGMAAALLLTAAVSLLSAFSRWKTVVVDSRRIGWRVGPFKRSARWSEIEGVEWSGVYFFRRMRLRGSFGSLSIPVTVEKYAELYRHIIDNAPRGAFPARALPWVIDKRTTWLMYLVVPGTIVILAGSVFLVMQGLVRAFGGGHGSILATLVVLLLFCGPAGLFATWYALVPLSGLGDRIEFTKMGMKESFGEDGPSQFWPVEQIKGIALGEAEWDESGDDMREDHKPSQPTFSVRVHLATGESIDLPGLMLGFRADKLAYVLWRAYDLPSSMYEIDPEAEDEEPRPIQTLNLGGREPSKAGYRKHVPISLKSAGAPKERS